MILINSADYVVPELQIEYGKLPPSMLPLGNRRLFEHQIEIIENCFGKGQNIALSLPANYVASEFDLTLLLQLGVTLIRVPEGLSLGESVLYSLNTSDVSDEHLYMLHGDTILGRFPEELDVIGVSTTTENYNWQLEQANIGDELIWCGFFSFSSIKALIQALALSQGNFVESVKWYAKELAGRRLLIDDWYDLGHLNTYFKSREKITTQRSFNTLKIESGQVIKSGAPSKKILAEGEWFLSLPPDLKKYAPQVFDVAKSQSLEAYYCLEYLTLPPLNEIFVYGLNPPFFWRKVFGLIGDLFDSFSHHAPQGEMLEKTEIDFVNLCCKKTKERLFSFQKQQILDPGFTYSYSGHVLGSLFEIAEACVRRVEYLGSHPAWTHGDLCCSNILFDSRADHIKVIDPRGMNVWGEITPYGDQKYDLAKLYHSIIGLYDFIIAGRFSLECSDNDGVVDMLLKFDLTERLKSIQDVFLEVEFIQGVSTQSVQPLVVLLFLSMLPLHADKPERQRAMVANALRLYIELD